jgi:hypothetical protein
MFYRDDKTRFRKQVWGRSQRDSRTGSLRMRLVENMLARIGLLPLEGYIFSATRMHTPDQ